MEKISSNKKCENCGSLITQHYGSGRFCCEKCARGFSTKHKRAEINKKVSETLKNKKEMNALRKEWLAKGRATAGKNRREAKLRRLVKLSTAQGKIELDISYGELESYRDEHRVCEICGRNERMRSYKNKVAPNKLAIDHLHGTNHFRGLLCSSCNYKLGWLENELPNIKRYLGVDSL